MDSNPRLQKYIRPYHVEYTSLLTKFRLRHVEFLTRGILFDHVVLVIVEAAFLLTKAQEFGDFSLLTSD